MNKDQGKQADHSDLKSAGRRPSSQSGGGLFGFSHRMSLAAWTIGVGVAVGALAAGLTIWTSETRAQARADGQDLQCRLLTDIQRLYLKRHITAKEFTPEIEKRTVDQWIKRLDGAKIYLTQADIDDINLLMRNHLKKVAASDCSLFRASYDILLKRVDERVAYAKAQMEDAKWKFDPNTQIQLDPDKRSYPKNKAEAEAFQRRYLQFQVSNYLATNVKLEEAKKNVIRNYERNAKTMKERGDDDLMADYLDSYSRALDPHSAYMARDQADEFKIDMNLTLEGIGASLSWQDGFTVVEQLIDGGSAKKDGRIIPQDRIVAVGQVASGTTPDGEANVEMENVIELPLKDVVKRIRGPKGTRVRLQILRKKTDGSTENFFLTLVREQIKLEDKAAQVHIINRDVGGQTRKVALINLPGFYADTEQGGRSSAVDMKAMVKEARDKGAEAMVLDLSTNGGGSLEDAVKIAGLFFRTGAVVKQSAREADESERLEDRDPTVDWDGPLVVLTSRASASASEIVAGTLKDYQRAVIVGADHTFGKGSVQQVFPLAKFALVKVTVGMFFTPGGFSTQHRGVDSDIVLPGGFATDEFGEKTLDYSLPPKKLPAFTSPQAYVATGPGAWDRVEQGEMRTLRERSKVRVAANPEFRRIQGEIKKAKARGKIVRVGDSLSDSKERRAESDGRRSLSKEEQTAEYLRRADIQESVNVALDLWGLEKKADLGLLARSHTAWDKRLADERAAAKSQRTAKATAPRPGADEQKEKPEAPLGAIKQQKNPESTSQN